MQQFMKSRISIITQQKTQVSSIASGFRVLIPPDTYRAEQVSE